jgi:hypothetical protein
VHAAEYDELGVLLPRGDLGQLEAVAGEVGEADHVILLVMVAEDDHPPAELPLAIGNGGSEVVVVHLRVLRRQFGLIQHTLPTIALRLGAIQRPLRPEALAVCAAVPARRAVPCAQRRCPRRARNPREAR